MILSKRWSRTEPQSVPVVDNKENPKSWAMKIKYLEDKFIVAISSKWKQIERILKLLFPFRFIFHKELLNLGHFLVFIALVIH